MMDRGGRAPALAAAAILLVLMASSAEGQQINVTTLAFEEGFVPLFGDYNMARSADGRRVGLHLNSYSGSGFISSDMYAHGFFSASIKLPADYTAGIVVAFYTSNGNVFEKNHDELDFEFLGNVRGKEWRVQTNIYGNGSTSRGREERYFLPFDPTAAFHRYSILWTAHKIIFYIDDTPIREVRRSEAMGGDYPSKPMSLYATIWDASSWATSGGRHKVNYRYSPFAADFTDLALLGCRSDPIQLPSAANTSCADADRGLEATGLGVMTPERRRAMRAFRENYMSYSVCYDRVRYREPFPECEIVKSEERRLRENGHLRGRWHHRRAPKPRRNRVPVVLKSRNQADM